MTSGQFRVFVIIIMLWAGYNAREAHVHTHELACVIGYDALCAYAEQP